MKRFFDIYGGVIVTLVLFMVMLMPVIVGAQGGSAGIGNPTGSAGTTGGVKILQNPLGNTYSFCTLVLKLIQAITVIGIPIAVLFIVWAGFKFVLARGNSGKLKEARDNFLYVIIGIGIFVGATLIANVIVNTLQSLGVQGLGSCR